MHQIAATAARGNRASRLDSVGAGAHKAQNGAACDTLAASEGCDFDVVTRCRAADEHPLSVRQSAQAVATGRNAFDDDDLVRVVGVRHASLPKGVAIFAIASMAATRTVPKRSARLLSIRDPAHFHRTLASRQIEQVLSGGPCLIPTGGRPLFGWQVRFLVFER